MTAEPAAPSPSPKKTVLVVEPDMSGHHADAARVLIQCLLDQGAAVIWGKWSETKAPDEPAWTELLEKIRVFDLALTDSDHRAMEHEKVAIRQFGYWRAYRRMMKLAKAMHPIDLVVVAYSNSMDKVAGLFGSPFGRTPWACMSMRDSFHHQAMGIRTPRRRQDGPAERLFRRTLAQPHLVAFLTLDPTLEDWAHLSMGPLQAKVITYPDIGVSPSHPLTKPEARAKFGLADRPTVSLVGSMELRKGVADALAMLDHTDDIQLLLAGRFQPECKDLIASEAAKRHLASGRLVAVDRRVSPEELQWALEAGDVVWAVYQGHYFPSNVLTQAACHNRPVLGTTEGLIGDRTIRKGIGEVADTGDVPGQVAAIQKILANPDAYAQGLQDYADSQSPGVFADAMIRAFRQTLSG